MSRRLLGVLALICLIFTLLWLALLILGQVSYGRLETIDEVLAYASRLEPLFYLTYINAASVTLSATAFFSGLFAYYRPLVPGWAEIGFAFIPVYAAINLVVYFSQVTVVPYFLELRIDTGMQAMAELFLRQSLQLWPDSAVGVLNALAYAILGIPSIVFGTMMFQENKLLRLGGLLLILTGLACIFGFSGVIAHNTCLSLGIMIGGGVFLLALIMISAGYLCQ